MARCYRYAAAAGWSEFGNLAERAAIEPHEHIEVVIFSLQVQPVGAPQTEPTSKLPQTVAAEVLGKHVVLEVASSCRM